MPRVVFTHPVKDIDHWLSKHSERVAAAKKAHGVLEPLAVFIGRN